MNFDVMLGNPPYQQSSNMSDDKFNTLKTESLYDEFIINAINSGTNKVAMIIPARWYNTSTSSLQKLKEYLFDGHLRELVDYADARDAFPEVRIAGGICYFLWDRQFIGNCTVTNNRSNLILKRQLSPYSVTIRDNIAYSIIHRIQEDTQTEYIGNYISKNPFNIKPTATTEDTESKDSVKIKTSYGYGYIHQEDILDGSEILTKYKVIIGKLLAGGGDHPTDIHGRMKIISGIYQIPPGEAFGPNFLMIGAFDTEAEARNLESYIKTRFVRFLIYSTLTGLNINDINFTYVPIQDFSIPWTDEKLYEKYNISSEEQEYIEKIIKEIKV